MSSSWPLLVLLALCSVASGYVYQCEPGTATTLCSIWNLQYNAAAIAKHPERLPSVNVPATVRTVRLLYEMYYYSRRKQLIRYDTTLHTTVLHNPTALVICDTRLRQLVLPPELQVAYLSNNIISVFETDPNKTYAIRYLDLSHNSFKQLANLSALVQLQTLNLDGNRIQTIETSVFARMANLTHLYLGDNMFKKIDLQQLPKALSVLWMLRNELDELTLPGVSLPALRELDIENNALHSLDLAAMFAAFPALEVLPIAYNAFAKEEAERIIADLKRHNVTYYIGMEGIDDESCDSDEYSVDNLCFTDSMLGARTFFKGIVLLVLAALVVVMFGFSVRWIWYQMRY
uniref:Leucine rich immune protein (Coil-less) n=1 Tax=Anopheles christyi TaxID=43041 RepID=A0A182JZ25_9DIPT